MCLCSNAGLTVLCVSLGDCHCLSHHAQVVFRVITVRQSVACNRILSEWREVKETCDKV